MQSYAAQLMIQVLYVLYGIGIIGSKPNAMTCKILASKSAY